MFNILLVSANSGLEAEIVEAWQADGKDYALVHYSFETTCLWFSIWSIKFVSDFFTQFLSFLQLHRGPGPDTPMRQGSFQ